MAYNDIKDLELKDMINESIYWELENKSSEVPKEVINAYAKSTKVMSADESMVLEAYLEQRREVLSDPFTVQKISQDFLQIKESVPTDIQEALEIARSSQIHTKLIQSLIDIDGDQVPNPGSIPGGGRSSNQL